MSQYDNKNRAWREKEEPREEVQASDRRFFVLAPSVNAVRRALFRAPGGARVIGRHDRETIACSHTMDAHSFARHWPILMSRLSKAGLRLAAGSESTAARKADTTHVVRGASGA